MDTLCANCKKPNNGNEYSVYYAKRVPTWQGGYLLSDVGRKDVFLCDKCVLKYQRRSGTILTLALGFVGLLGLLIFISVFFINWNDMSTYSTTVEGGRTIRTTITNISSGYFAPIFMGLIGLACLVGMTWTIKAATSRIPQQKYGEKKAFEMLATPLLQKGIDVFPGANLMEMCENDPRVIHWASLSVLAPVLNGLVMKKPEVGEYVRNQATSLSEEERVAFSAKYPQLAPYLVASAQA